SGALRYSRPTAGNRVNLDCDRIEASLHLLRIAETLGPVRIVSSWESENSTRSPGLAGTLRSSEGIRDRVLGDQRRNQLIPIPPKRLPMRLRRGGGGVRATGGALGGAAGWIGSESKSVPTLAERDTSMSSMGNSGPSLTRADGSSSGSF